MNSVYYIWKKRKKLILKHDYEFSRAIKKLKQLHNLLHSFESSHLPTEHKLYLALSIYNINYDFLFVYDNEAIFEGLLYFHATYKESLIFTPPISMWQTSGEHLQSFMYLKRSLSVFESNCNCTSAELNNEFITQLKTKHIL